MTHEASSRFPDSTGQAESPDTDCRSRSMVMKFSSLFGCVRSATAGVCLLLGVGTLLLWLLTYNSKLEFFNNVAEFELYCVESWKGKLRLGHSTNTGKTRHLNRWTCWSIPDARLYADYAQHVGDWEANAFVITWNAEDRSLAMPHWAWVTLAGLCVIVVKPRPKLQYGFPDLLLLTAIVAICLGAFAVWTRTPG